ncbi:MAG: hypothetical protein ABIP39_05245 [Polyangiaceae bacterium]
MDRRLIFTSLLALMVGCRSDKPAAKDPSSALAASSDASAAASDQPIAKTDDPPPEQPGEWGILDRNETAEYASTIAKVTGMVSDRDLQSKVARRKLGLVNVNWEDTGRSQGSSLGPNISDLTLQVRRRDEQGNFVSSLMPVIRPPNFADRTGDVPSDKFFVRVGNERAGTLRSIPLTEVLQNLKAFASMPDSIRGSGNLLAPRDTHFLVSAQAVFLPIPKKGKAEFNPVLFNYQSAPGSPAILSILITREGTSISVIENRREESSSASGSGQEIYFNNKGQRAGFTAERKSDVESRIAAQGGPKTDDDRSALAKGADVLFLVQVPLVHKNVGFLGGAMPSKGMAPSGGGAAKPSMAPPPAPASMAAAEKSDVEQAVLGHGPNLGPFNEGHQLAFVRDTQFPIRVTVQFYKATSNGVVSDVDLDSISRSIGSVYEHAEFVGSLVLPEGDPRRPTSWQKIPREWFPW